MAALRTAASNLLRLAGFRPIQSDFQSILQPVTKLLSIAMRRPEPNRY